MNSFRAFIFKSVLGRQFIRDLESHCTLGWDTRHLAAVILPVLGPFPSVRKRPSIKSFLSQLIGRTSLRFDAEVNLSKLAKMKRVEHWYALAMIALLNISWVNSHTTITSHTTFTITPPYTTTVNPSDPTVWHTYYETKYYYPGTVTTTIPYNCITHVGPIYIPGPPPETTRYTTITHIERASTTITDPNYPTFTRYLITTASETFTTSLTSTKASCTNTLVQVINFGSTSTHTETVAPTQTTITTSSVCTVAEIRFKPHPLESLFETPSRTPYTYDNPTTSFTGTVTRVTSTLYSLLWITQTVSLDVWTRTTTKCDNPVETKTATGTHTRTNTGTGVVVVVETAMPCQSSQAGTGTGTGAGAGIGTVAGIGAGASAGGVGGIRGTGGT